MIDRLLDSLKQASARAGEFSQSKEVSKPQVFLDFISALKTAAGSSHNLAHARMEVKWLDVRDVLEKIIDMGKELPLSRGDDSLMWLNIKSNLDQMIVNDQKLAFNTKMTTRPDTLKALDIREHNSRPESRDV